jgi:hypothetical protein
VLDSIDDEELRHIRQITVEFHDFIYPGTARRVDSIRQRVGAVGFHNVCFSLDNSDVLFINRNLCVSKLNVMSLRTLVKYARVFRGGLDVSSREPESYRNCRRPDRRRKERGRK